MALAWALTAFGVVASVMIMLSVAVPSETGQPAKIANIDTESVAKVIGSIVLLAALIERAVEVAMLIAFGPTERRIAVEIAEIRAKTAVAAATLEKVTNATVQTGGGASQPMNDAAALLNAQASGSIDRSREISAEKQRLTNLKSRASLAVSLVLSSVFAVGGINLVKTLFQSDFHGWMLSVELSVTALVLAGGAEGAHQIFKRFLQIQPVVTN